MQFIFYVLEPEGRFWSWGLIFGEVYSTWGFFGATDSALRVEEGDVCERFAGAGSGAGGVVFVGHFSGC